MLNVLQARYSLLGHWGLNIKTWLMFEPPTRSSACSQRFQQTSVPSDRVVRMMRTKHIIAVPLAVTSDPPLLMSRKTSGQIEILIRFVLYPYRVGA